MMKRFKLALRILLGLPPRGVRIDESYYLNDPQEAEVDHSRYPPLELVFTDWLECGPTDEVIQKGHFRVCVFHAKDTCDMCAGVSDWLVLELQDGLKWYHLTTMHASNLGVMLSALNEAASYLGLSPDDGMPVVEIGGVRYFLDASRKEVRAATDEAVRFPFLKKE